MRSSSSLEEASSHLLPHPLSIGVEGREDAKEMSPDTTVPLPEEEHLLPLAQAQLDDATRAAVRQAIAVGRFQEALATLRGEMQRVKEAIREEGHA